MTLSYGKDPSLSLFSNLSFLPPTSSSVSSISTTTATSTRSRESSTESSPLSVFYLPSGLLPEIQEYILLEKLHQLLEGMPSLTQQPRRSITRDTVPTRGSVPWYPWAGKVFESSLQKGGRMDTFLLASESLPSASIGTDIQVPAKENDALKVPFHSMSRPKKRRNRRRPSGVNRSEDGRVGSVAKMEHGPRLGMGDKGGQLSPPPSPTEILVWPTLASLPTSSLSESSAMVPVWSGVKDRSTFDMPSQSPNQTIPSPPLSPQSHPCMHLSGRDKIPPTMVETTVMVPETPRVSRRKFSYSDATREGLKA